jgi:hypothetical protein
MTNISKGIEYKKQVRRFEKNMSNDLADTTSICFPLVRYFFQTYGKNALKKIRFYLYLKAHKGGFRNINKKFISKTLNCSTDFIDSTLDLFHSLNLINIFDNQTINRKSIQVLGKNHVLKLFNNYGFEYQKYYTVNTSSIFDKDFCDIFLTKYIHTLAIINDNNKSYFKFKEYLNETIEDKETINRSLVKKLKKGFYKNLEHKESYFNEKYTEKDCIIHKISHSLVEFATSLDILETSYLNLPYTFLSAVNQKSRTTAFNWVSYINDLDLIKKTPVYFSFKETFTKAEQMQLVQAYPQLYNKVFFTKNMAFIQMPNKLEFPTINAIELKSLTKYKLK